MMKLYNGSLALSGYNQNLDSYSQQSQAYYLLHIVARSCV